MFSDREQDTNVENITLQLSKTTPPHLQDGPESYVHDLNLKLQYIGLLNLALSYLIQCVLVAKARIERHTTFIGHIQSHLSQPSGLL